MQTWTTRLPPSIHPLPNHSLPTSSVVCLRVHACVRACVVGFCLPSSCVNTRFHVCGVRVRACVHVRVVQTSSKWANKQELRGDTDGAGVDQQNTADFHERDSRLYLQVLVSFMCRGLFEGFRFKITGEWR